MKRLMATAAALALLAGISAANAQSAPADTSTKGDKTMQQSHKSSLLKTGTPKKHVVMKRKPRHHASTTTGAGGRVGPIGGAQNDPSIHQSIQRDSRGTPKGPGSDYNK